MEGRRIEYDIFKQYQASTDIEVLQFIRNVLNGDDKLNYVTVAFFSEKAAKDIEQKTGKRIEGSCIVLDINAVHHIENRHGLNGKQDQSMKNDEDIARMGYVITNYDEISYNNITTTGYLDENGKPSPMISISKKIDGTYYVIGAVNSAQKKKKLCYYRIYKKRAGI